MLADRVIPWCAPIYLNSTCRLYAPSRPLHSFLERHMTLTSLYTVQIVLIFELAYILQVVALCIKVAFLFFVQHFPDIILTCL